MNAGLKKLNKLLEGNGGSYFVGDDVRYSRETKISEILLFCHRCHPISLPQIFVDIHKLVND